MSSVLAISVVEALRAKGLTLSTAESCTGGMIAASITGVAGASDVFEAGFVTYSNDIKSTIIDVSQTTLQTYGAVSENVAYEMAIGALNKANSDIAISVTGIAGPSGGTQLKPVGMVCFGLAMKQGVEKKCETQTQYFGKIGRDNVRAKAHSFALNWVKNSL